MKLRVYEKLDEAMKLCGWNKTTLLDYPGRLAATIFTGGCNFRCPFCQNSSLVLSPEAIPEISESEVLHTLKKRKHILEGVCITGGEPTLWPDLKGFIYEIKALGYPVKLDTNGSHPQMLKELAQEKLIDMVAMDIKTCQKHYDLVCGISGPDMDAICESVRFLKNGNLDYEFRTTVVRELHAEDDFISIGQWLAGAKSYVLQAYRDSAEVLQPGFSSYSYEELSHFQKLLQETIPSTKIRGIDGPIPETASSSR